MSTRTMPTKETPLISPRETREPSNHMSVLVRANILTSVALTTIGIAGQATGHPTVTMYSFDALVATAVIRVAATYLFSWFSNSNNEESPV